MIHVVIFFGSLVRVRLDSFVPHRGLKQTTTYPTTGLLVAVAFSASSAVGIAADVVFLDARKAVTALLAFTTKEMRIAAGEGMEVRNGQLLAAARLKVKVEHVYTCVYHTHSTHSSANKPYVCVDIIHTWLGLCVCGLGGGGWGWP